MDIQEAIKLASVLTATAISQNTAEPDNIHQQNELKQRFHEALGTGRRITLHTDDLRHLRFDALKQMQKTVRGVVGNFALSYVRSKVGGANLDLSERDLVELIEPTLIEHVGDITPETSSRVEVSKDDYERLYSRWLALDFNEVAENLEDRFGGDYAKRLLNEQMAASLARELGFSYSYINRCFSDYKAGKKLERTFYSRKNEWSHTPPYSRELDYGQQRNLASMALGLKHAAEEMRCEDLSDAANAIQALSCQLERQRGFFDSRTKSEFGTSTVTLFNEKLVLAMTKSAANKLIIFLRKYAEQELKDTFKAA